MSWRAAELSHIACRLLRRSAALSSRIAVNAPPAPVANWSNGLAVVRQGRLWAVRMVQRPAHNNLACEPSGDRRSVIWQRTSERPGTACRGLGQRSPLHALASPGQRGIGFIESGEGKVRPACKDVIA